MKTVVVYDSVYGNTEIIRATMAEPLLMTKLYIPPSRPGLVRRPRLIQRLDESLRLGRKLTLLSAPAGFGKTTLLIEWIQGRSDRLPPLRTAWVSLDERDNDPARFLAYLCASLETLHLPIREGLLGALRSPQPPPVESVLASLVSELSSPAAGQATGPPLVLVLDDYHIIRARAVHDAVAFLLDHLPAPPHAPHLIIASRSDPPLSLARLRGQGLLTELRVADLRFTEDEAAALLRDAASLPVSAEEIAALEARTEGWITGLQLATIALQAAAFAPGSDISRFIQEFTGSHRFVLDYLVEEVFSQQPAHIKRFLLQTSILDRLAGSLCDAVCFGPAGPADSQQHGQETLEALERANLFIVPLDGERRWYRYHRLFADLLRSQLERLGPELGCAPAGELHRRASLWYKAQGLLAEAVGHALAAEDFERAADLVEGRGLEMLKRGEMTALLGWLEALPARGIRSRPQLCIYQAWALALSGQLEGVEPSLQAAEVGAEAGPLGDRSGQIAAIRSYVAAQRGEIPQAVDLAHRALALLDEGNLVVRSVVAFTLGGAHLAGGDLAAAARVLAQASEMGQAGGNIHLAVPASTLLADLEAQQGRLHAAFDDYQRALEMAGHSPVAAQAHSGLGMILYEWNDLEAADHHLSRSIELGRLWGNADALSSDYIALARLRRAQGDLPGAVDAMHEAERLAKGRGLHVSATARVAAGQVRLAVIQGDLPAVERWVRDCGLDVEGEINPLREGEYIVLVRALLALGQADAAGRLLARLLEAVETDGLFGHGIEILVLQALAHGAQSDQDRALAALTRAVALAEPEGCVRTFLDEGPPLRSLLSDLRSRLPGQSGAAGDPDPGRLLAYSGELLAAFAAVEPGAPPTPGADQARKPGAGPVEPLSERELEVLRLVAAGLTNQAIADRLFIAVSTVKSHTNSIYGKLGVRNRTQAVAQARALGLL
jgi:LuxR family maltose regulon positive regulatory protein